MKTKLTTLLLCFCAVVFAQERQPLTVVLSQDITITGINRVQHTRHKGDSITLIEARFDGGRHPIGARTAEGNVSHRDLRRSLSESEFSRYWSWLSNRPQEPQAEQTEFAQQQARLQAQMRTMSRPHQYLTIFTGDLELNFSHQRLLGFLSRYMNMNERSNDFVNGQIVSHVTERTAANRQQRTLTIRYDVRSENNFFFPTQVEITGTPESVIMLFLLYYPTTIQADELTVGTFTSFMLPDKITLTIDQTGNAKMLITKNE